MHLGAILDGDCLLSSTTDATQTESSPILPVEDARLAADLSVVWADEPAEELEEFLLSA
jgi:hypothetical protein